MSRSLLALAVCVTAAVHAEPLPLISNDAKYCVKPDVCDTVIVTAINSPDAALNAYADSLFNSAYADSLFNTETAAEYRFTGFDHAALEAWITRVGKEELGDGEDVPNNDYSHDYGVTQIGETAHYRQLEFIVSTYLGGAHGMYGSSFHVLPKAGELRRLTLDDILLPGQRQKLDQLQKQAFERALKADGYGSGAARLSTKHSLALTNRGGATTADLLDLAREIRDGVEARFGVRLVPEPVLVGCDLEARFDGRDETT